jgi:2-alkenal reductase
MQSKNSSGGLMVWAGVATAVILLFGCGLMMMVGLLLVQRSSGAVQTSRPATTRVEYQRPAVLPTPRPLVVVTPPDGGLDYESATLINIYEQVNPSVVNITVLGKPASLLPEDAPDHGFSPDDFYSFSGGSGIVWDEMGHIITNEHVVEGAEQVQVTFYDGAVAVAEVIGVDADTDLAVLRIETDGYELLPIRVGTMDDVRVGMRVAAIGNPFGLEGTLTSGIVSALGRSIPARGNFSIPDSIQTDAAINPGNSGGPLLSERGELIGVNAQIRSEVRANSGVGFAIPVSIVSRVVPALIADGAYEHSYMGVSGATLSPICAESLGLAKSLRGALVLETLRGTPAADAGLRGGTRPSDTRYPDLCPERAGGDLITAIDGQAVRSFDDVLVYLERYTSPGDTVRLTVLRDEAEAEVLITLAARPE